MASTGWLSGEGVSVKVKVNPEQNADLTYYLVLLPIPTYCMVLGLPNYLPTNQLSEERFSSHPPAALLPYLPRCLERGKQSSALRSMYLMCIYL